MAGFNRIQLLVLHSLALWCAVNAGGLHPHTEGYSHQIHHPDGSTHHSTFIKHNTDVVPRDHDSSVYDHSSGHVVSVHNAGPHGAYPGYRSQVVAARPAGGALYAAGGPAYAQYVSQPAVTQVVSRPVVSQVVAPATTAVVGHGGFGAVYPSGYGYGGFGYGGYGGLRYGGAGYGVGLGYGAGLSYGGGLGYGVGLGYGAGGLGYGGGLSYGGGLGYGGLGYGGLGYGGAGYGGAGYGGVGYGGVGYGGVGYGGVGYGSGYGYSRTSFRRGPYIGNRRLPTAFGEVHVPHHEYHHHEHDTVHPPTFRAYGVVAQAPAVSVVHQAPAVQVAAPVGVSVVQPATSAVYSQRFAVHAAPAAVLHAGGEVHHKLVGPDGAILGRLKK